MASGLPGVKDAAVAPPGFVNLQLDSVWYGEARTGRGRGLRCRLRRRARESAGGVRLREPHGAADCRLRAKRGVRRFRRSPPRLRGQHRRARVLRQRRRRADRALPRVGRREAQGEEPPPDGYQGDYVGELAKLDTDPAKVMEERIRETLERFRVHMDLWVHQSEMEPSSKRRSPTSSSSIRKERAGPRRPSGTTATAWSSARTGGPRISRSTSRTCGLVEPGARAAHLRPRG